MRVQWVCLRVKKSDQQPWTTAVIFSSNLYWGNRYAANKKELCLSRPPLLFQGHLCKKSLFLVVVFLMILLLWIPPVAGTALLIFSNNLRLSNRCPANYVSTVFQNTLCFKATFLFHRQPSFSGAPLYFEGTFSMRATFSSLPFSSFSMASSLACCTTASWCWTFISRRLTSV